MAESVILSSPLAMVLYGAALFCCLFDRSRQATKGWLSYLSAAIAILTTAYVLLLGASRWDAVGALTVFLLLNMEVRNEL